MEEAFMKFARVGAAVAAAAIVVTACGGATGGDKPLKIGISLPLSGSSLASAGPAEKGAQHHAETTEIG